MPKRHHRRGRVGRYQRELKRVQSGCVGKHGYDTRKEAAMAMARMRRQGMATPGEGLQAYRCIFCRKWHVGHGNR